MFNRNKIWKTDFLRLGGRQRNAEGMAEKINGDQVVPQLDFKEIIGLNIRNLQVFGNIIPEFRSQIWTVLYCIYSAFMIGLMLVAMLASEVPNMIMVLGDMEKTSDASFLTLTHMVQLAKYYYLFKHRHKLRLLINSINREQFHPKTLHQYNTLKKYVRTSKINTTTFLLAGFGACSFWGLYPFTEARELSLPLAGWFPFDVSYSPLFGIIYAHQTIGATVNGMANISIDSLMAGFLYLCMLTTELINIYLSMGDLEKLTAASFLTLTHLVETYKLYCMFKYRTRVQRLINTINVKEFQPKTDHQRHTLKNFIRKSKIIFISFNSACILTCIFWGIYPFTEGGELFLPLAEWFPFETNYSPVFEIIYVYQVIAATFNGLTNISLDTFMTGLIMVVCAQLNILNDTLKNLREHAEAELSRDEIPPDGEITAKLQRKMNEKLVECVVHHRQIIDFANEVTFLFTKSILGQFIVSVVIICITLFEITLLPWGSVKFFSLIFYQYCILLEIFLWCYYGNEVILESTELTKCAYFTDWTDCSPEFKQNLLYFMTRSQVSLKLYAGGFFTLSLETFVTILKSSWSYFAVLNRVHSEGP